MKVKIPLKVQQKITNTNQCFSYKPINTFYIYICLTGKIQDMNYNKSPLNPIRTVGGGIHPPPYGFLPLFKKSSSYNPYLKFLDFSQLLVADTPRKFFFSKNFVSKKRGNERVKKSC